MKRANDAISRTAILSSLSRRFRISNVSSRDVSQRVEADEIDAAKSKIILSGRIVALPDVRETDGMLSGETENACAQCVSHALSTLLPLKVLNP
jgi:hypothetical protein